MFLLKETALMGKDQVNLPLMSNILSKIWSFNLQKELQPPRE